MNSSQPNPKRSKTRVVGFFRIEFEVPEILWIEYQPGLFVSAPPVRRKDTFWSRERHV